MNTTTAATTNSPQATKPGNTNGAEAFLDMIADGLAEVRRKSIGLHLDRKLANLHFSRNAVTVAGLSEFISTALCMRDAFRAARMNVTADTYNEVLLVASLVQSNCIEWHEHNDAKRSDEADAIFGEVSR